jgi:hypothetical protein
MASNHGSETPLDHAAGVTSVLDDAAQKLHAYLVAAVPRQQQSMDSTAISVLDTCGAILALDKVGALDVSLAAAQRRQLVAALQDRWHDTASDSAAVVAPVLQALDALGAFEEAPSRWLEPLEAVSDAAVEQLDWLDPVSCGVRLDAALTACVLRAEVFGQSTAVAEFHATLDALDGIQASTGLWGSEQGGRLSDALLATARLLPYFRYVGRPVSRTGRLRDTLLTASWSGEFEGEVPPVHQLALTEALATSLSHGRYRADEVAELLRHVLQQQLQRAASVGESPGDSQTNPPSLRLWDVWLSMAIQSRAAGVLAAATDDSVWWLRGRRPNQAFTQRAGALTPHQRTVIDRWLRPVRPHRQTPEGDRAAATIVIPCFDLGAYLHEAVDSVFAQSCSNVQLVIVDDGSEDEFTSRVLSAYERQDVHVVRQANQGLAAARNAGVMAATAPFVSCLDADDRLAPDFVARSTALLEANPSVGFVNTAMQFFDERDELIPASPCLLPEMLVYNRAIVAAVFRREAWQRVGGYFGGFSSPGVEDWDFWLQLIDAGYEAGVVDAPLFEYRVRAGSMSQAMYEPERWQRLRRELAERHAAAFGRHLAGVVAEMARREAVDHAWGAGQARAVTWWQHKAEIFQRATASREQTIADLRTWIDQLEEGKAWLEEQCAGWEAAAKAAEAAIAAHARACPTAAPAAKRSSGTSDDA